MFSVGQKVVVNNKRSKQEWHEGTVTKVNKKSVRVKYFLLPLFGEDPRERRFKLHRVEAL